MLQRRFLEAFQQYSRDFQKSCSKEEAAASIPVEVGHSLKAYYSTFLNLDLV